MQRGSRLRNGNWAADSSQRASARTRTRTHFDNLSLRERRQAFVAISFQYLTTAPQPSLLR